MSAKREEVSLTLLISGFGTVGRAFTRLLVRKRDYLVREGINVKVVCITDSKGGAVKEDGFTAEELMELTKVKRSGLSETKWGIRGFTTTDGLDKLKPDVLIEVTPSNYETGEPGLQHVMRALENSCHVILANKAPLALKFKYIMSLAKRKGSLVKYKATVMAGTPLLDLIIHGLKGAKVLYIKGILNGTTNFILSCLERGLGWDEALHVAREKGIMEADPRLDLEGWDPAAKLVILVNTIYDSDYSVKDVKRKSLTKEVVRLIDDEFTVRYLAIFEKGQLKVEPVRIHRSDFLAQVKNTYNCVELRTEYDNVIRILGKGAGGTETAFSILSDLMSIAKYLRG